MRRVLVVDDHRVLSELIVRTLEDELGVERVLTATDVDEALALARSASPDTVILDAQLPSGDGVALLPELLDAIPEARVIVLTARPRTDRERAALAAGAVGYLGKDGSLSELMHAVRRATTERPARDPELLREAAEAKAQRAISPREREVLAMLAEGKHVAEVAELLRLSQHTARDYVKSLLGKLGARSQLEAVTIAAREGLVRVR